jgi:hypothetical protein
VIARPPIGGAERYLVRALRPKLDWIRIMPWRTPSEDTEGPSVVLIADDGKEVVLLRPGTLRQAERAASRFRAELQRVGPEAFQARYGVHLA